MNTDNTNDKTAFSRTNGSTADIKSRDNLKQQNVENLLCWEPYGILSVKEYKKKIWKNIILLSIIFLFNFVSFGGLSNLQSSLHIQQGMGVICSSILYMAMVVSCLFLPKILVYWLGHKWVVSLSILGYIIWMFANGYAVWATMIPASIIVGICAAPLWTAQCAYFTELGKQYASLTNQSDIGVTALFFGVFFMFFQSSAIFGNIISTTILRQSPPENYTLPSNEEIAQLCGMNDCPGNNDNNTNLATPPDNVVWTLCAVYIVIAIVGFIISCVFVDNLPKALQTKKNTDSNTTVYGETCDLLGSTIKHMKNKKQLLLIPITIYSGFEQTFKGAEFNKSWVTCSLGIWMVGLIGIPGAISDASVSFFSGSLVKYIGRLPLFVVGLIIDTCLQTTLALWTVNPDEIGVYYTITTFWGASDGIWQTQINAMYAVTFPDSSESAFSNYRLWESLGFIIANGYSYFLCAYVKLYVLFTMLWIGLICYFIVEWMNRKEKVVTISTEITEKTDQSEQYEMKDIY